jgi:Uma2 family endonuclease
VIARVPLVASDADVLRISAENPGWRIERDADGALLMAPPTGIETSRRNVRLTRMLDEWAETHGYVALDSSGGFRLPDASIVSPDGSLISKETYAQLTAEQRERFFRGAPEVAIELCSQTDNPVELRLKLERMRRSGASYVVLIDPYRGTIWTDGTAPAALDLDFAQLLK